MAADGEAWYPGESVIGTRTSASIGLFATLIVLASSAVALPTELTGQASILDGDTLEIHGTRVRLWGIDAPESAQLCRGADSNLYRCGAKAASDLDALDRAATGEL